jgi:hypothetical protein
MNQKLLLSAACIGAAILVVLASFTTVVGVQSAKSDFVDSPLFGVRSRRAIDSENQDIVCEYVGKGKEIVIPLPKRDNETVLIQRAIDILRGMDDREFDKFVGFFISKMKEKNVVKKYQIPEIRQALFQLRNNPKILKNLRGDRYDAYYGCPTLGIFCWILLFIIWFLKDYIPFVILIIVTFLRGCF